MKAKLARGAVKKTAKHSANGTLSKLRRTPVRSGALVGLGCVAGFLAGWLAARPLQHSTA